MMILNYNFDPKDLPDWSQTSVEALFNQKRRDAIFIYGVQIDHFVYLIRDHLGTIPLFFRQDKSGVQLSTNLTDLVKSGDTLHDEGVLALLSFGCTKIIPLLNEIQIVPPGTALRIDSQTGQVETIYQHQFLPETIPRSISSKSLIARGDYLLAQAVQRQIKYEQVGLFLSGGIDSSLIGINLKKNGVRINAYTAALWGKISSEIPFAKINAEVIGVNSHHIAYLEGKQYETLYHALVNFYKGPHATTTALGIRFLWESGQLGKESQVFFGQNSDTMTCSVGQQFHTYFMGQLPKGVIRGINRLIPNLQMINLQNQEDPIENYLTLVSDGLWDHQIRLSIQNRLNGNSLHDLTLMGMLVCHTPSDGEVITQPAINQQIMISNPYYDVDLIEFCMGLPLWYRLGISSESKFKIALKKRIFQDIAIEYLPKTLVQRKKGFTVPIKRDEQTKTLSSIFPHSVGNLSLKTDNQRFGAWILQQWCEQNNIAFEGRER